jgi:hypothetical protein
MSRTSTQPTRARRWPLALALGTAVVVCGVPYWLLPLKTLNLPDALPAYAPLVVGVAALLLAMGLGLRGRSAFGWASAILPLVAFVRVLLDVANDPTSHNLWPFELVIAGGVGLLPAAAGAALGVLINRMRRGARPEGQS